MYLAAAMFAAKPVTLLLKYIVMMENLAQCLHFTEAKQNLSEVNRISIKGPPPLVTPQPGTQSTFSPSAR